VEAARRAATGLPRPAVPWLPELPAVVRAAQVGPGPGLPLAVADVPAEQRRAGVHWDPEAGHLLVLGGPRSGRTTTLVTLGTAALGVGRHVHAVGLPAEAVDRLRAADRQGALGTVLDSGDVRALARLLHLLDRPTAAPRDAPAGALPHRTGHHDPPVPSPDRRSTRRRPIDGRPTVPETPRPLLLVDGIDTVLDALAAVARGSGAEHLLSLWSAGSRRVAMAATTSAHAASTRLAGAVRQRLVLPVPDPALDAVTGVPAALSGARTVPGRAVHLDGTDAILCQVALPGGAPSAGRLTVPAVPRPAAVDATAHDETPDADHGVGSERRSPPPPVRPLPPVRVRPLPPHVRPDAAVRAPGRASFPRRPPLVTLGVGGDEALPLTVDLHGGLLVAGPPGSGRTTALAVVGAALTAAGFAVTPVRAVPGPSILAPTGAVPDSTVTAPMAWDTVDPEAALMLSDRLGPHCAVLIDDLDDLERTHPPVAELADALLQAPPASRPVVVVTTTSAAACAAFRGPVPVLRRRRRLLVLDLGDPASAELVGPSAPWFVDPERPPGRGVLLGGREPTPVQVYAAPAER